ncbi:TRAP transporter small permease [Comamonas odontotermitis]|uniref:TRAP transporter small permease n=1 Tax=Comamonas odontotermitis TaxID=379895 RepID=UPI003670F788
MRTSRHSFWSLARRIPEILTVVVLAVLILFLVISVFTRYAMDLGLTWSDELARLLFAWLVLVGFALAVRHRANVGVDWFIAKLSMRGRRAVAVLQDLIIFVFCIVFTWEAWITVGFSLMQQLPALEITIAWLYGSALAAGVLMVIYGAANLIDSLRGRDPVMSLADDVETTQSQ